MAGGKMGCCGRDQPSRCAEKDLLKLEESTDTEKVCCAPGSCKEPRLEEANALPKRARERIIWSFLAMEPGEGVADSGAGRGLIGENTLRTHLAAMKERLGDRSCALPSRARRSGYHGGAES